MQIEISNSWYDLVRNKTTILLKIDEPMMVLTGIVDGNVTDKSKEELKNLALDYIFKLLFVDRAMPEAIEKVDNVAKEIEEAKKVIAEISKLLTEAQTTEMALNEKIELIKTILLELEISEESREKLTGQPTVPYLNPSSTNLYSTGDLGQWKGRVYISKYDNNGNEPDSQWGADWWTDLGTVEEYLASLSN